MEFNNQYIYDYLKARGINQLFHANTELTASSFLNYRGIMSRGLMEQNNLPLTYQKSDEIDKQFGVWNDIFLDDVDIHARAGKSNYYGNVLFCYATEILLTPGHAIYITKTNPIDWKSETNYFTDTTEFESEYNIGTFEQMITLKNSMTPLDFNGNIQRVILDKNVSQAFINHLNVSGLPYEIRNCHCC